MSIHEIVDQVKTGALLQQLKLLKRELEVQKGNKNHLSIFTTNSNLLNSEENANLQRQLDLSHTEIHNLRERGKALAKDLANATRRHRDEVHRLKEQLSQLVPARDQYANVYVSHSDNHLH